MEFFKVLQECDLKRDNQGIYRLEYRGCKMDDLNHLFGLSTATLTPDKESIINFAAITYLFGLLGINIETFTAIPTGFIGSYNTAKGVHYGTFLSYPYYVTKEIMETCNCLLDSCEELNDGGFFANVIAILKNEEKSFLDKVLEISVLAKPREFEEKLARAIKQFSDENDKNCVLNHKILEDIVTDSNETLSALSKINEETGRGKSVDSIIEELVAARKPKILIEKIIYLFRTKKYKKEMDEFVKKTRDTKGLYDFILNSFILDSGYYVYRGRDRKQDGAVLNSIQRAELLMGYLKSANPLKSEEELYADLVDILNMCSTDYAADIVLEVMKAIKENNKEKIDEVIPPALNNRSEKHDFRNAIPEVFDVNREGRTKR